MDISKNKVVKLSIDFGEEVMKISAVFISMMIFTTAIASYASDVVTLSKTIWERNFGDADYMYQNKAMAFSSKDSALFIAGTYSTSGKGIPTKVDGIWIWKINDAGERAMDVRLKNIPDKESKYINVESMAISDNSDIFLVARLDNGQAELVKLNTEGKVLFSNKLDKGRHIVKIIPISDNKFLLIGYQSLDSLIMKIDASGEVLSDNVFDFGQTDMSIDGIATEEGGFVLIENSGKAEKLFMGASDIWMTKYDSIGQKVFEKSFPGRYGSIARSKNGSYAVAYDKSGAASQDIWVKAINKDFITLWDVKVTETNFGLERFKIASLTNGDYMATGPINGRPWVSYISSTGVKKWDFSGKTMDVAVGTDFISKDNSCFIVSSVVAVNEQFKLINKIRVIKFQPE